MTYKILSLDGGGMRGVISAQILKEIEETVGQPLHEYFDLIAGTSTGSILAAGIACGMSADDLIDFYQTEGKNIFLKSVRRQRKFRLIPQFFGNIKFLKNIPILGKNPLYPHKKGKDKGLANILEKKLELRNNEGKVVNDFPTMADIKKTQLLILAYDVLFRNTTWFANDDSTEWWYDKTKLWEICTASASAPTFFPPYPLKRLNKENKKELIPHIDGGVSANNPTVAAIAHALCMEDDKKPKKIEDIAVLSIGTGQTTHPYTYKQIKNWGLLNWVENIPNIFLDPSAENSGHISKRIFLGIKPQNYLRLNFELNKYPQGKNEYIGRKIKEDIDNPDTCNDLIEGAKGYLDRGDVEYDRKKMKVKRAIEEFFNNVPVEENDNLGKKQLAEV
ncbi:MAG: patatin-like phospholipase family protein [Cyanobacteria bacterium J06632_19]